MQLEEVRDELIGSDSITDANVAEQVEAPMARDAPPQPRRSARLRQARELLLLDNDEPATYAEAMVDPDSVKWQEAMESEIESMRENQVWNLVDPPDGVKIIECKWIYKRRKIWMEMFTSTKLDLLQKVFDKFKELTTMKHSRPSDA